MLPEEIKRDLQSPKRNTYREDKINELLDKIDSPIKRAKFRAMMEKYYPWYPYTPYYKRTIKLFSRKER